MVEVEDIYTVAGVTDKLVSFTTLSTGIFYKLQLWQSFVRANIINTSNVVFITVLYWHSIVLMLSNSALNGTTK